jgi:hypothetical protein
LDELNARLEGRRAELQQELQCTISDVQRLGQAWVLPHPERQSPGIAPMVRDDEIERIAVQTVIAYEQGRGWQVESVESENRGFDLISKSASGEVRFIEVKGRAGVGEVALSDNEYKTAERLKADYWLYVVYNCASAGHSAPEVHCLPAPAQWNWQPVMAVAHYRLNANEILEHAQE